MCICSISTPKLGSHVQALDKFPLLDNYVRAWPVDDLIRAHLKYSSSSGRRQQEKKAAGLNLGPRS